MAIIIKTLIMMFIVIVNINAQSDDLLYSGLLKDSVSTKYENIEFNKINPLFENSNLSPIRFEFEEKVFLLTNSKSKKNYRSHLRIFSKKNGIELFDKRLKPFIRSDLTSVYSIDFNGDGTLEIIFEFLYAGASGAASDIHNLLLIMIHDNKFDLYHINSFRGGIENVIDIDDDDVYEFILFKHVKCLQPNYLSSEFIIRNIFAFRENQFINTTRFINPEGYVLEYNFKENTLKRIENYPNCIKGNIFIDHPAVLSNLKQVTY